MRDLEVALGRLVELGGGGDLILSLQANSWVLQPPCSVQADRPRSAEAVAEMCCLASRAE